MISNPLPAIRAAVLTKLSTLGTPVFIEGDVPDTGNKPYVVITGQNAQTTPNNCPGFGSHSFNLDVVVETTKGGAQKQADDIANAAAELLTTSEITLAGYGSINITSATFRPLVETGVAGRKTFRTIVTFTHNYKKR